MLDAQIFIQRRFIRSIKYVFSYVEAVCVLIFFFSNFVIISTFYFQTPKTKEEWIEIAKSFETEWNFPNCIGAIDGKHIQIVPPPNSGSHYYNYKKTHSIVLMAVANANYEIVHADIGASGRLPDGGIWKECSLNKTLQTRSIILPDDAKLPRSQEVAPFVFVADDAFPLKKYLLKPYANRNQTTADRVFSYRLSRAKRVVENVFGILSSKFRVLKTYIAVAPDKVEKIVWAIIVLHNMLIREHKTEYIPSGTLDAEHFEDGYVEEGQWRDGSELTDLKRLSNPGRHPYEAIVARDLFRKYFNEEGAVSWQLNMDGVQKDNISMMKAPSSRS